MTFKKLFLLIMLGISTSCGFILQNMDKDILKENKIIPKTTLDKTSCDIIQKNIIVSDNKKANESFKNFLNSNKVRFSYIEKVVLWSLLQMNLRPDLSSPTAKLQMIIKIDAEEKYYNSFTKNKFGYPYLNLLNKILRDYKSKKTLSQLASQLDSNFTDRMFVSKEFEFFLNKKKDLLLKYTNLKKRYFRGDDPLKHNERLPRLNFQSIVKKYLKTRRRVKYITNNYSFKFNQSSSFVPNCNFDMGLYKDSIFLISEKEFTSNIFGYKEKQNAFIATSDHDLSNLKPLNKSFLIHGNSNTRSAAICSFKNKLKPQNTIWLTSTNSRDPGQHLYHLLEYGLSSVQSVKDLDELLKFSRHQFLKSPMRLVIESRRSSNEQLQELLKLNIPIYNSKKLAKIWGFINTKKRSSFILDERRNGHIECSSK